MTRSQALWVNHAYRNEQYPPDEYFVGYITLKTGDQNVDQAKKDAEKMAVTQLYGSIFNQYIGNNTQKTDEKLEEVFG